MSVDGPVFHRFLPTGGDFAGVLTPTGARCEDARRPGHEHTTVAGTGRTARNTEDT